MRIAYAVTTFQSLTLSETLHTIPTGERCMVIDNSLQDWPLSKAWNTACRRLLIDEGYDVVLLMNDDVILRPDTGPLLARALLELQSVEERPFRDRRVMLLSAYNVRDIDARIMMPGNVMPPEPSRPDAQGGHADPFYGPGDIFRFQPRWGLGPDFSCFAIAKEGFTTIGDFEEKLPLYFEDNDYHRRITLSGYEALSYAPYWHHGSQTSRQNPELESMVRSKFERSRDIYELKWGGLPGHETFMRPWNR